MKQRYQVGQFAALAGVSIRTLHHYDSIGLLSPSDRSEAGHRLYSAEELQAAEQQWRDLLADVHANLDQPPASRKAQELAARWD